MQPSTVQSDRVPIRFGAPDRELFGWYHAPATASDLHGPGWRDCGIVLCNPIGDDYVRSHRPLRHLAERLAQAGFAVLRFDFHGTGDSSGDERDRDRVRTWIGDIGTAVEEVRRRSGARTIGLAGLRLGATLALAAAAELGGVGSLVLWGPYPDGKSFVAESTRLHKMHKMLEPRGFSGGSDSAGAEGQEALGFLLTHATIAELHTLQPLTATRRPAPRVLLVGQGPVPGEDQILKHLRAVGSHPETRHVAGPKFLTTPPHKSPLPEEEIEAAVSWLCGVNPQVERTGEADQDEAPRNYASSASFPPFASSLSREVPILFGQQEGRSLFGILVKPPPEAIGEVRRPGRPAIIMLNAGTVHRIGPHRYYVNMARRWARLGFYVLRMDLSGIGDSPASPGCAENLCYPSDMLGDLDAAMDLLRAEIKAERFVIMGLCSGGDLAFKRGIVDRRVAGVVMMNPRTFCVNDLRLIASYQYARHYERSIFLRESWEKALRGEVDFMRVARRLIPKGLDLLRHGLRQALELVHSRVRGDAGAANGAKKHHNEEMEQDKLDIPGCLRLMAERGVDTFLLVARHDPGVDYVDAHYGPAMRALASTPGYRREDLEGTNHTFTSLWAQQLVSDMITAHLQRRYLGAAAEGLSHPLLNSGM